MFPVISRLVFLIALAFLAAYITFFNWGSDWAIAVGVLAMAIPLFITYMHLAHLRKHVFADDVDSMTLPSGFWEDMFVRLQRLIRGLKLELRSIDQQHSRFIEAFQASPNGIIMLDDQDQIEWCNAIAERFFGLNFKRDVLQRINFLIRRPEFIQYIYQRHFEEPLLLDRMGPGESLSLMLQIFPFGENRHLLLVQDVTDLQKADAMRRDFVANVSHEMRTPITVLIGFLETMQTLDLDKSQQHQYFELMMAQSKRMKSLVEDLLTLANLEANALPAPMQEIQIPTLMALLKNDAEALSKGHHKFQFHIESSHNLMGEEREIISACGNLVSNAIRYSPDTASISATWNVNKQGEGEFSVTDNGPGISSEHLSRLTERFYRVDRSRSRDTGGTGLGLAIVKHIASRHQAQLTIESTLGKGSTFKILFPRERVVIEKRVDA